MGEVVKFSQRIVKLNYISDIKWQNNSCAGSSPVRTCGNSGARLSKCLKVLCGGFNYPGVVPLGLELGDLLLLLQQLLPAGVQLLGQCGKLLNKTEDKSGRDGS